MLVASELSAHFSHETQVIAPMGDAGAANCFAYGISFVASVAAIEFFFRVESEPLDVSHLTPPWFVLCLRKTSEK